MRLVHGYNRIMKHILLSTILLSGCARIPLSPSTSVANLANAADAVQPFAISLCEHHKDPIDCLARVRAAPEELDTIRKDIESIEVLLRQLEEILNRGR